LSRAQTLARLQTLLMRVRERARRTGEPAEVDSVPPPRGPDPATPVATPVSSLPPIDLQDDGIPIATADLEEARMPVAHPASSVPPSDLREDETPIAAADVTVSELSLSAQSSAPPGRIGVEPLFGETRSDTLETSPADELTLDDRAEDRAPASSRRPVAGLATEAPLDQLAFGSEEALPALHTPPPESGKVPAAPDITDYDREELVPETTHPTLDATITVAQFVGQAAPFAPASFLALLDATLGL
jgi:hypothetical protein